MLTPAAWWQYADNGTILAAVDGADSLLGYTAFRLPRNDVVVASLVRCSTSAPLNASSTSSTADRSTPVV
jgi:hypothetical protein